MREGHGKHVMPRRPYEREHTMTQKKRTAASCTLGLTTKSSCVTTGT
jgi:hypothetical protein